MIVGVYLFRIICLVIMLFLSGVSGSATEVALKRDGGVYTLPVRINESLLLILSWTQALPMSVSLPTLS